ncbi:MAG: phosphoribosylformylglycinamidine cyclo-ligase [Deltaproteobacteria bacterium]|nr:phosphoribosylformylglycinamidine cyclo-ligase [Deltaproteobacteria bacterium]
MLDHVDYTSLDRAKQEFIAASRRTLRFAEAFGFVVNPDLGASANIFSLDLRPFLKVGAEHLHVCLLPEGLGTADDARPDDLAPDEELQFWHNIGVKTVSCLTNDAASSGMQTILLGLYLPSSTPERLFHPVFMKGFLDGFVDACRKVACVYIAGETPQLTGKLVEDKLDIAGALFGLIPPGKTPITGERLDAGHHIVFVESSGTHENGFTTLRKMARDLPQGYRTRFPSGQEFWQAINVPGHLYTGLIQELMSVIAPVKVEPITGHGWLKLMRSRKNLRYVIEDCLPVPELFSFLQKQFKISTQEMLTIFNYGVGLAIYTDSLSDAEVAVKKARDLGYQACIAGKIEASSRRELLVKPWGIHLEGDSFGLVQ